MAGGDGLQQQILLQTVRGDCPRQYTIAIYGPGGLSTAEISGIHGPGGLSQRGTRHRMTGSRGRLLP